MAHDAHTRPETYPADYYLQRGHQRRLLDELPLTGSLPAGAATVAASTCRHLLRLIDDHLRSPAGEAGMPLTVARLIQRSSCSRTVIIRSLSALDDLGVLDADGYDDPMHGRAYRCVVLWAAIAQLTDDAITSSHPRTAPCQDDRAGQDDTPPCQDDMAPCQDDMGTSLRAPIHATTTRGARGDQDDRPERGEDVPIPAAIDTPEMRAAWARWLEYRRSARRKPVTVLAAQQQLRDLAAAGVDAAIAAIDTSIASDWQGLFPRPAGGTQQPPGGLLAGLQSWCERGGDA